VGVGFGLGWGYGIVRASRLYCLLSFNRGLTHAPLGRSASPQGWGSKIIDTKQAFPRKMENLLESAQAAAADAMSVLQGGNGAGAKAVKA